MALSPGRTRAAAPPQVPEALAVGDRRRVTEIVDGDTLILSDGREVRLVGLQAPKLPLGRPDFEAWPLADAAKAELSRLTLGQAVTLAYGGRPIDRHGRMLAHLYRDDGSWVQGAMLRAGMARVYTFADNRTLAAEMYAREDTARRDGRGIWDHPFYQVRGTNELDALIDTFQVVKARVRDVATVDGRVYLNFGPDWRSDFTVTLAPRTARLFAEEGIDVRRYDDARVQVRGWLTSYNGPLIEATHPEQIRKLDS
ncbi:thermonuclease family protein [Rhodovibrio salinarum]|nr:thermonuclease family protein [Rhodovibrio salinarum]